jgi:hypothetical protein
MKKTDVSTTVLAIFFIGGTFAAVMMTTTPPQPKVYAQIGQPQPEGGCPALTTDPILNKLFCETGPLLSSTNPENQQHMDMTYNPPQTLEQLAQECTEFSQKAGYSPQSYCSGVFSNCDRYQFTYEECYANNFLNWEVPVPDHVMESIGQKITATGAQIDAMYQATMCPKSDGTYGDYC